MATVFKPAGERNRNMAFRSSRWIVFAFLLAVLPASTFADELAWGGAPVTHPGTFLMMSDLHFDPFADPALVPALIQHPVEDWEGILNSSRATAFAPYGKDSNWPLLLSALREAKNNAPEGPYDYAILTGDYLVHESRKLFEPFGGKDERAYEDFVLKTEVFTAREVQKNLPNLPVYFCLGNNDSECGDYMIATKSDFLKSFSNEWGVLAANPAAATRFTEMGNYVLPHPTVPGMELISLNDVYWSNRYSEDSCTPQRGDQGHAEMDWLESQLKDARNKHLKVQLIMHIPPGADVFATYMKMKTQGPQLFWAPKYEREFLDLVKNYPEVLVSGFAGHTHMDDFRVLDRGPGKDTFFIHICPAVSPIRGNNPEFQVARYDKVTGDIQDMATFVLTNLDTGSVLDAQWDLQGTFSADYGPCSYNGSSLLALTNHIQTSEAIRHLFSVFYRGSVANPEKGKFIPDDAWKVLNCLHTQWTEEGLAAALGVPAGK
jgi:sphingomyelin phosphodiesterase acid-like 3